MVRATPTGAFARRTWFLYEWLTGRTLDVPDPGKVRVVTIASPQSHRQPARNARLLSHDSVDTGASSARVARWARAIGEAGIHPATIDELERLQRVVVGDARFVKLGLREDDGFVGTHDRDTQEPIPDHISARPQDVRDLRAGLISSAVKEVVEMPDREIERLRRFLAQGQGHLSTRAREQEFRAPTDEEATRVEGLYRSTFK